MAAGDMAQLKEYFGLTNAELIAFKKADPDGFAQLKDGIVNGTLTY